MSEEFDRADDIRTLKDSSRLSRDRGDRLTERDQFHRAVAAYLEGIDAIDSAVTLLEKLEPKDPAVIVERSDCHGMLGGLYRRLAKLSRQAAIWEYDRGYEFERYRPPNKPDSYNLVNRIVVRLLNAPKEFDEQIEKLEAALQEVEKQTEKKGGPRKDDAWALADKVTLMALLNHDQWQNAVENLKNKNPEKHALNSCVSVLEELAAALPTRTAVLEAAASELKVFMAKRNDARS